MGEPCFNVICCTDVAAIGGAGVGGRPGFLVPGVDGRLGGVLPPWRRFGALARLRSGGLELRGAP